MTEHKISLVTSEVEDHTHGITFPDDSSGRYETDEVNGHTHFADISGPGSVTTSGPNGQPGHQHVLVVPDDIEENEKPGPRRRPDGGTDQPLTENRNMDDQAMESKRHGGAIREVKQATRNGVHVGLVTGYLATWDVDTGKGSMSFGVPDRFERGAFTDSIRNHVERGNRQVRLKDHHGRTVGGFPIETLKEDSVGLFGVGEVNLETQQGREAHSLARQDVLTDFSVGFSVVDEEIEDGVRVIKEAILWEASIVDEPANQNARILEVKTGTPFLNHPLADRSRKWDPEAALRRVKKFTHSAGDEPSATFKNAFVWYDKVNADDFESYKGLVTDVVGDQLVVVPAAVLELGERFDELEIPAEARARTIRHLERYFAKMGADSPFALEDRQFFGVDDVRGMTVRRFQEALHASGVFSKGAAKYAADRFQPEAVKPDPSADENPGYDQSELKDILADMKSLGKS
jgi:HK97 family phage prohead protease